MGGFLFQSIWMEFGFGRRTDGWDFMTFFFCSVLFLVYDVFGSWNEDGIVYVDTVRIVIVLLSWEGVVIRVALIMF